VAKKAADDCSGWIDGLVDRLTLLSTSDRAFNQYGISERAEMERDNERRRENLRLYLRQMVELGPRAMLVGEAPGYRGCRLTGIPFTSERILLGGLDVTGFEGACQIFGAERGYRKTSESERVVGEVSATIVWETIASVYPLPLLWNAYPFHPFCAEQPMSNRRPTAQELASSVELVSELLLRYEVATVLALGESAAKALKVAGISFHKVRHPSYGGKVDFVAGLQRVGNETAAFLPVGAK
jgi:uracil-DNA glycosylase